MKLVQEIEENFLVQAAIVAAIIALVAAQWR